MGKVFAILSKKRKTKQDLQAQEKAFRAMCKDPQFSWQDATHRDTVAEAAHAAKRLSLYERQPQNDTELKQYIKDQQTVEKGIETIQKNKNGNLAQIKSAIKQAIVPDDSATQSYANSPQQTYNHSKKRNTNNNNENTYNFNDNYLSYESPPNSHIHGQNHTPKSYNPMKQNRPQNVLSSTNETHNNFLFKSNPNTHDSDNTAFSDLILGSSEYESDFMAQRQSQASPPPQITANDQGTNAEMNVPFDNATPNANDAEDRKSESEDLKSAEDSIHDAPDPTPNHLQMNLNVNSSTSNQFLSPKRTVSKGLKIPTNYSGIRIQVDVLGSFHDAPWILDKKRDSGKGNHLNIKHSDFVKNIDEYHKNKRVSLTNSHNFLWLTSAVQSAIHSAERESELTRMALDRVLHLLPIPFRDKIWEICNEDNDVFMFQEDFATFADALFVATGQYLLDDEIDELEFELRDMTEIFVRIVNIDTIFKQKRFISKWSKTDACLSCDGATEIVLKARNLLSKEFLKASDDLVIALLTGFTRKALKHAVTYCTRIFWKLLTGCWWDEEDDDDMALPMSLSKYQSLGTTKDKSSSRRGTKINMDFKESFQAHSMEVLFPDLLLGDNDSDDFDQTFNQFLCVAD